MDFVESTDFETFAASNQYGTIKKVSRLGGVAGTDSYERWEREFSYDGLSRAKQSRTTMQVGVSPAVTLVTQTKFDSYFGRTKQLVYPASSVDQGAVSIYQAYNALGALVKEGFAADYVPTNPEDSPAIRRLNGVDGRGLLTSESYGVRADGIVDWHSNNLYDSSGWLLAQCASAAGYTCTTAVPTTTTSQPLDQRYRFDVYGNLKTQYHNGQWSNAQGNVVAGAQGKELYSYDALQRLISATRTPSGGVALPTVSYSYDDIGGLLSKSDYGSSYSYDPVKKHQVKQVNLVPAAAGGQSGRLSLYDYDENGNTKQRIENGVETTLQYDIANLPRRIVMNTTSADFYEAPGGRYLQRLVAGGLTRETYSLEKTYEREVVGGNITVERYYLTSGSLLTIKSDGRKLSYLHTDRLGSPVTITEKVLPTDGKLGDAAPTLKEHKGFDAFGKALDGQWGTSNLGMLNLQTGEAMNQGERNQRGFTGHEHLDEFALIHMNGRAYDYNLGRFYGVDPFIQFPGNSQSLNPYGYLMNNPLSGTDPTGYAIDNCPDGNCRMTEVTEIKIYKDPTSGEYYAQASDGKNIIEVKSFEVKGNGGNVHSFELSSAVLAEAIQNIDKKNVLNSQTSAATSFNGVSIQGRKEDQLRSEHLNNYMAKTKSVLTVGLGVGAGAMGGVAVAATVRVTTAVVRFGVYGLLIEARAVSTASVLGTEGYMMASGAAGPSAIPGANASQIIEEGKGFIRIGSDASTIRVATEARRLPGVLDVVVHGTRNGKVQVNGMTMPAGDIADVIINSNQFAGCGTVRLVMCHAGAAGQADELKVLLGKPILAPTDRVGISKSALPDPNGIPLEIDNGGTWRSF